MIADKIKLKQTDKASKKLLEKLNWNNNYSESKDPPKSIMHYDKYCDCDDGYLCDHRLQYLFDYIYKHYIPKGNREKN